MSKLLQWIGQVPTTNARILVTLSLAIGTGVRYWLAHATVTAGVLIPGWTPSVEWLGFLAALGGLDVAQFSSKRFSDAAYVAARTGAAPGAPPAPGGA